MINLRMAENGEIYPTDADSQDKLSKNFFGQQAGRCALNIEEVLYLITFQNASCFDESGKKYTFNELASAFSKTEAKIFVRYNAYRDWRDRGLIIRRLEDFRRKAGNNAAKNYPVKKPQFEKADGEAVWYGDSMFSVIEDDNLGQLFFEKYWLGQWGIYKQQRGGLLKMSFLETVYANRHFGIKIKDSITGKHLTYRNILSDLKKKREYTRQLYEVYEKWRDCGYVVKTGFKFGSHFRIYFPGASPVKQDKWLHSRHVLHVFPGEEKLLISEWARVVRVAHSVKKTFILAIPKLKPTDYVEYPNHSLYLAFRRKKTREGWVRETTEDGPRYLLAAVSEDEHIGGFDLASLLKKGYGMGLEVLLSITDRETSVTYYLLKKVLLGDSDYEYYEIEWIKP
ncbi:MAG: tRNA-intron lyase [Candidatus Aenigmarchaeota archaeon]|nr:tRNA-intron lyase [Candidatus Aenigmarchaeota archaeon]